MKIRNFVSSFWLILMFIGSSFGIFYLITGQNIITGQNREVKDVLPATDSKNLGEKVKTNDIPKSSPSEKKTDEIKKEVLSPELIKFNEIMQWTSNSKSLNLLPKDKKDASTKIIFRFGTDTKANKDIVAILGSGLDEKKRYFAWLVKSTESVKLGELKKVDDSSVLKLGVQLDDNKYSDFAKAVLTVEADDKSVDLKNENVLFSADIKFEADSVTPGASPAVTPTTKPSIKPTL